MHLISARNLKLAASQYPDLEENLMLHLNSQELALSIVSGEEKIDRERAQELGDLFKVDSTNFHAAE